VGVKECDRYLDRYDDCVKKLPDAEREVRIPEGQAMRKVLRDEAERPESKDKVGPYCQAALAALKDCP
jgi:hypothetical protein